jgi:hypothetical protein
MCFARGSNGGTLRGLLLQPEIVRCVLRVSDPACTWYSWIADALFSCESEQRLCFGNDMNDNVMATGLSLWHSVCDNRITFSPSTPAVSTLSTTNDPNFCTTAYSACQSHLNSQGECSLSDPKLGPEFSTCFCQPELLSLAYTCVYMGNLTCQGEPAALTNIPGYNFCRNAPSVLVSAGVTTHVSQKRYYLETSQSSSCPIDSRICVCATDYRATSLVHGPCRRSRPGKFT